MTNEISNFDKLTLSSDFLFKQVMLRKRICKHLLKEILQVEIADITYLATEETIDTYPDSRGIRLDVKIADAAGTHYNLEMQVRNPVDKFNHKSLLPKRTRYYQAMLDVNMLHKKQDFDALAPTYIIFICLFDFLQANQRIYTFKKRCLENLALELADEATIIFLNTSGTKGHVSSDIQSLYDYINSNAITSDFVQEIADTIVNIKNDKKVRTKYMTYEMRMKDLRNEAFAEGEAKGESKEKFATAKRLLKMGLSINEVAQATLLSINEIQLLQNGQAT